MAGVDLDGLFIVVMGGLLALCIICVTLCLLFAICLRILRGKKSKNKDADETKMIQEIYQGLSKMEDRIDSLETILLSKEERMAEEQKLHAFEQKIRKG